MTVALRAYVVACSAVLSCVACSDQRREPAQSGTRADTVALSHPVGTNLPPWAACSFPQNANAYARRRAEPCPPEAQATRAYRVEELLGCWQFRDADSMVDLRDLAGPLRLIPDPSARMRKRGWVGPGMRGVEYIRPIPSARAIDTAMTVVYWRFVPPDSLQIGSSDGFTGSAMTFRVRGDSLVGMLQSGGDFVVTSTDTASDPVDRVTGIRVLCRPR